MSKLKTVSLEGCGPVPCLQNVGEVHAYTGPPLSGAELLVLFSRAVGRHAQLGVAIDNLRRVLQEEHLLRENLVEVPQALLREVREALELAQGVIPGEHREALAQVTRALERLDIYEDALPPRGQA